MHSISLTHSLFSLLFFFYGAISSYSSQFSLFSRKILVIFTSVFFSIMIYQPCKRPNQEGMIKKQQIKVLSFCSSSVVYFLFYLMFPCFTTSSFAFCIIFDNTRSQNKWDVWGDRREAVLTNPGSTKLIKGSVDMKQMYWLVQFVMMENKEHKKRKERMYDN